MSSVFHPVVSNYGPESATCVPANLTAIKTDLWAWTGWIVIADLFVLFLSLFMNWVPIEFAMVGGELSRCVFFRLLLPPPSRIRICTSFSSLNEDDARARAP